MVKKRHPVHDLRSWIHHAIPLTKLDFFTELLEEGRFRLSDCRHMSDLVHLIVSQEKGDIKIEVSGRPLSVVFDGTTWLGEAVTVVVRYINDSFSIQQCLIRLQLLTKSMTGEKILSMQYSIGSNLIIAMMHDTAACKRCSTSHSEGSLPYARRCWMLFSHARFSWRKVLHSPPFLFYYLVGYLTAQSRSCFGRRELADLSKDTQQQDGGVNLK